MIKVRELNVPHSCLNKADMDEPLFVLRAKDPVASQVIRYWASESEGLHEPEKIQSALKEADKFDDWHEKNNT